MNVDIKYKPSFATLFVTLAPGDSIIAEADAMASMSSHVQMRTCFNGGFFKAILKRIFGGESLFVNEFYVPKEGQPAELVLTQPTPGDVQRVDLSGNALFLQPGAFIACAPSVKLSVGWAGLSSWFGGEGLFRLKVKGTGPVWIGAYGSIFSHSVAGEYVVDSGHLVAYEPTVVLGVGLAGGIFSSLFSGEGFVSRMRGQGIIYLQSRSISGLVSWTNGHLY